MKTHLPDSVTDKVYQYVDNGIFLDGRLKALGVTRFKHRIGTQLTDKDAEAHRLFIRYCQTGRHPDKNDNSESRKVRKSINNS